MPHPNPRAGRSALVSALVAALVAIAVPTTAGDLGDFRESVDRDNAPRQSERSNPPRSSRNHSGQHMHQHNSGSGAGSEIAGAIFSAVFGGHLPQDRFSWGDTPYAQRRNVPNPKLSSADMDLSLAAFNPRPGHFRARTEASVLADGSAIGLGLFALVESTHTPGLAVSHHQFMDFSDSDRLGVTAVTLEPRFITAPRGVWSWNLGPVVYGAEGGVVNAGLQLGTGVHLTPMDPLSFEGRLAVHIMSGLAVADVNLIAGVEFMDGIFATVGYRGLVGPLFTLHSATVGIQFDFGFGGPRRPQSLSIANR